MQEIDPRFPECYFSLEEAAWKMLYQDPRFLAEDLYGATESILSTITRYYDRLQSSSPDTVWMVQTIEEAFRHLGLPSWDMAIMSFLLFRGFETPKSSSTRYPELIYTLQVERQPSYNLFLDHRSHPDLSHPPRLYPR